MIGALNVRRTNQRNSTRVMQPPFWSCDNATTSKIGILDLDPNTTVDAYLLNNENRINWMMGQQVISNKLTTFIVN